VVELSTHLSIPFIGFQKNKWNIVNGIIAECTFNSIYWIPGGAQVQGKG